MAIVKTPTQWIPPSGTGYVVVGNLNNLIDNLGNSLIDNTGKFIVTNPTTVKPKYPTVWTGSGA